MIISKRIELIRTLIKEYFQTLLCNGFKTHDWVDMESTWQSSYGQPNQIRGCVCCGRLEENKNGKWVLFEG